MAGTSIEEDNLVYKCIRKSFEIHGYLTDLPQVLLHCAGKEKREAITLLLSILEEGEVTDQQVNTLYSTFDQLLEEAYEIAPIALMEGMEFVLFTLKNFGIRTVFNTGYNKDVAMKLLKKVNCLPGKHIDALVTADMVEHSRPAPDMILHALNQFGIVREDCIKIGDSIIDIEEGRNAEVGYTLGVTTGAHNREQLMRATPDEIFDNITELIPFIQRINAIHPG